MAASFAAHPLDGAMLWFDRRTGTYVRLEADATRALRRGAPRVVMFGITNACNLRCTFCSRDVSAASAWTLESAVAVLRRLGEAGVLEVAFGGGEPFAFRGFGELLEELARTTRLALNVTTNGTLLEERALARVASAIGQVRLSVYADQPWRHAAELLARARVRWGANVLLEDRVVPSLAGLLAELSALGATDASLLTYVGPDPARHLGSSGASAIAAIVTASPLPCRLSVCAGERIAAPRLPTGLADDGDCGAGLDFLTITSDRRVKSCSFSDASWAIETGEDVLSAWRARRDALSRAAARAGCARADRGGPGASTPRGPAELRVWQGFSGNNSGECVLVAKFEAVEDAARVLDELLAAGQAPGEPYVAPWRELFARERVDSVGIDASHAPDEMLAIGRTFVARTSMALDDDFPELRALAWRRGAYVRPGGIHVHDEGAALFAIRARDAADAKALATTPPVPRTSLVAHGPIVVGSMPTVTFMRDEGRALTQLRAALEAFAGGRPLAMEPWGIVSADEIGRVLRRSGEELASAHRIALSYHSVDLAAAEASARALGEGVEGRVTAMRNLVLVDGVTRKKRLAVLGHRRGATVSALESARVSVHASFETRSPGREKGGKAAFDAARVRGALDVALRSALGAARFDLACKANEWVRSRGWASVTTDAPSAALRTLDAVAREADLTVAFSLTETDALERAVRRLVSEVRSR